MAFKKCRFFLCFDIVSRLTLVSFTNYGFDDCQSFNLCEWLTELASFNTIHDDVNFRLFLSKLYVLC